MMARAFEVFFDNVRVTADSIVGEEGKGWDYAKFLLANERTTTAEVPRNKRLLARLKSIAASEGKEEQTLMDCPLFRYTIAEHEIELTCLEAGVARVARDMMEEWSRTKKPPRYTAWLHERELAGT